MQKLLEMGRGGSETKPIAAVAAYEDAPTDARVSQFCGNLSKCLGGKAEVNRQMWLLNELRMPTSVDGSNVGSPRLSTCCRFSVDITPAGCPSRLTSSASAVT